MPATAYKKNKKSKIRRSIIHIIPKTGRSNMRQIVERSRIHVQTPRTGIYSNSLALKSYKTKHTSLNTSKTIT